MDIGNRTRCTRPNRRFDLLEGKWAKKRFEQHRERVKSAKPRIDFAEPVSTTFTHVQVRKWWNTKSGTRVEPQPFLFQIKQKKQQKEAERYSEVLMCNLILLRHLTEISMTKRVDDGVNKKIHWRDYFSAIINMRKQQVDRLRRQLSLEAPAEKVKSAPARTVEEEKTTKTKESAASQEQNPKKKAKKKVQIQ